jgi:ABC-type glycerol-3-phosphate transport system permease component
VEVGARARRSDRSAGGSAGNVGVRGARSWDIAAQGLVVMVPPPIVAALAGRSIVRGLTLGTVKR